MQRPGLQVVLGGFFVRPGDFAFDLRVGLAQHDPDRSLPVNPVDHSLWAVCRTVADPVPVSFADASTGATQVKGRQPVARSPFVIMTPTVLIAPL
jgi:hypothetical protein